MYIFWEMYAANPGGKGQFYVGNPDLKPEKSLSYELSVEKDWGDRSTVHLGVFRNEVKDLISTYWTGKLTDDDPDLYPGVKGDMIMAYENIPEATLQGVELYGSHRLGKNIYLNAGYTFLDAKDKTNGTRLKDRAKHQVTFGVSYQPENIYAWDLSFDLVSNIGYYFNMAIRAPWATLFTKPRTSLLLTSWLPDISTRIPRFIWALTTSAITRTLARILTAISVACTELVWNINSKHSGKVKEQIKQARWPALFA